MPTGQQALFLSAFAVTLRGAAFMLSRFCLTLVFIPLPVPLCSAYVIMCTVPLVERSFLSAILAETSLMHGSKLWK